MILEGPYLKIWSGELNKDKYKYMKRVKHCIGEMDLPTATYKQINSIETEYLESTELR